MTQAEEVEKAQLVLSREDMKKKIRALRVRKRDMAVRIQQLGHEIEISPDKAYERYMREETIFIVTDYRTDTLTYPTEAEVVQTILDLRNAVVMLDGIERRLSDLR